MAATQSLGYRALPTNTVYGEDGAAGVNVDERSTTPLFAVPDIRRASGGHIFAYGKATGAVSAGACTINATTGVIGSGSGYTATSAFAAGEYGFVQKAGNEF